MHRVSRKEPPVEPLTAKEKEVLAELVKGKSNKEIAAGLLSPRPRSKPTSAIFSRNCRLRIRTQAVIKAIQLKLV